VQQDVKEWQRRKRGDRRVRKKFLEVPENVEQINWLRAAVNTEARLRAKRNKTQK
jgi:hypothetical protein